MIEYKIDSYLENIDENAIDGEISTHKKSCEHCINKEPKRRNYGA